MTAQNKLRLSRQRLGKTRVFELYEGDILSYKLKGVRGLQQDRITAFGNSSILLEGRDPLPFDRLRLIRIKKDNYHNHLLQKFFIHAAVLFPMLQLVNNSINGNTPLINQAGLIVSGSALTAFLITRRCDIRNIRLRKDVVFRVFPVN